MSKKRKSSIVFLLVAVACGLVAAFLTGSILSSYTRTVEVWVVTKDIGPYERLDRSVLASITLPPAALPEDVVLKIEEIDGKYTRYGLARETVVRQSHLADKMQGGPLSAMLTDTEEPDKRAFALPFNTIISVGGNIGVEDRIDLIASLNIAEEDKAESTAKVIARNVRVLSVTESQGIASIVVVVTPEEAEELVFLLENGKVYAVLNPYEADVEAAATEGFYTAQSFLERHRDSPEVIILNGEEEEEPDLDPDEPDEDEGSGGDE